MSKCLFRQSDLLLGNGLPIDIAVGSIIMPFENFVEQSRGTCRNQCRYYRRNMVQVRSRVFYLEDLPCEYSFVGLWPKHRTACLWIEIH